MRFLNNLTITFRLLLATALPILGILALAGMLAFSAQKNMQEAQNLMEVAEIAPEITRVVHDLQKERGKTAGFLSTNDPKTIAEGQKTLKEMYKTTIEHRAELEEAYTHMNMENFSEEFQELSGQVKSSLDEIEAKRKKVIARDISKSDAIKSYTRQIRELLEIIEYIASHSDDAKTTDLFASYISILEKQEAMGKERATGAGVLTTGSIDTKARARLSELKGVGDAYAHFFEVYATKHEKEMYGEEVKNSASFKRIHELRGLFLNPEMEFKLFDSVSAKEWFDAYTHGIEDLTKIEAIIRDDIQARVVVIRDQARHEMFLNLGVAVGLLLMTIIFVIAISKSITGAVSGLTDRMKKLAEDDLDFDIPDVGRGHQLADMADTLSVFRENAEQMKAMEAEQERLKLEAEVEKIKAMNELADSFDGRTAGFISSLAKSSDDMQETAQIMSAASEETSVSSSVVASAASEADSNVQTVAAAAEELSSSSQEIARQISDVATRASTAASEAEQTSEAVNELEELAESIGDVVGAIKDIAEQTNLLALNATIEAARAGNAGKGFAVVADEVKKLANETGQKTEEIDRRVNRIQEAISNAVNAMGRIIDNVKQIDHATSSVAGAVEEQNAATAEIGRNVLQASSGTQQVSQNISEVQDAAGETGKASVNVLESANTLAEVSQSLRREISGFLDEIRTDGSANDLGLPDEKVAVE